MTWRPLLTLAALAAFFMPATAQASVGVNISPAWGDTVDGRDIPKMERVLADFRPHTARMPWVLNGRQVETLRFNAANGINSLVIDNETWAPEQVVSEIAQAQEAGYPVTAIEGVNEPDIPATGYTPTPTPISDARLAQITDRQTRLYQAVAGRWPVLCPAAVYRINEPALNGLPCDIVSTHRYPGHQGEPLTDYDAELPATTKPIWVTEVGSSTWKRLFKGWVVNWEQQRDRLVWMDQRLRANGAARVIVYSLQDTGTNIYNPGQNWGLYTWYGSPKLSAAALRG